jgi:hypothetical protein
MKPLRFYMAKGRCLAPGWGITATMKEMRERIGRECPYPQQYRIVAVFVIEEDECNRHDLEYALLGGNKHAST